MTFLYPAWWPNAIRSAGLLGNFRISDLYRSSNTGGGVGALPSNNLPQKNLIDAPAGAE
jgi:hypothetical protein